ncbi:hypothetical protein [Asticcacaulis machinosus]|uniref:Uncharacterized protein n=1 Tax=Asticcacaulis machinosus TaxID=2984211 RepID=A0ABT5HH10_9CAUL|nr:hypothetical protein [Asticcacaulis machinosus]MDC7675540.1 hypothetical protein [Asticcacaulis machinosus]
MTLNDLKDVLELYGFRKTGKQFVKSDVHYIIKLAMDILPSRLVHRIMIHLHRTADDEFMADFSLDEMFIEDKLFIINRLPIKDKNNLDYTLFLRKFSDEYLPIMSKMGTNEGVATLYPSHIKGRGLITWKLREELKNFDGWIGINRSPSTQCHHCW